MAERLAQRVQQVVIDQFDELRALGIGLWQSFDAAAAVMPSSCLVSYRTLARFASAVAARQLAPRVVRTKRNKIPDVYASTARLPQKAIFVSVDTTAQTELKPI